MSLLFHYLPAQLDIPGKGTERMMVKNTTLREARIQRHWTQSTLAIQLNTTRMSVVRWEHGLASPSLYFRERLCLLFGMTEQELGLSQRPIEAEQSSVWLVPEEHSRFFTGREAVLRHLYRAFWEVEETIATHTQTITGLAGIGKTQVALAYAYRFRQHYSTVAWLHAETRETLLADLNKLASALHLPLVYEQGEAQLALTLKTWLEATDHWLLIFDHVEDFALISQILPSSHHGGHVLITTRMQATGHFSRITLEEMNDDEGALLLLRRSKLLLTQFNLADASSERCASARQICRELGGHPLALDQAGSYIEETGCSLVGYLERFQQHSSALLSWHSQHCNSYPYSVTCALLMAQKSVESQSAAASELLRLSLFLSPENIPEEFITQGSHYLGSLLQEVTADLLRMDEAFTVLNASALLRRDPETRFLSMHRLVQIILRDQLAVDTQCLWVERCLKALDALFPANPQREETSWPRCKRLLPHVLSCLQHMERLVWGDRQTAILRISSSLLLKAGNYLLVQNNRQEAEALFQRVHVSFKSIGDVTSSEKASELCALPLLFPENDSSHQFSRSFPRELLALHPGFALG